MMSDVLIIVAAAVAIAETVIVAAKKRAVAMETWMSILGKNSELYLMRARPDAIAAVEAIRHIVRCDCDPKTRAQGEHHIAALSAFLAGPNSDFYGRTVQLATILMAAESFVHRLTVPR